MPDLHLGAPQEVLLLAFAAIALALVALFTVVARSASGQTEFAQVQKVGYMLRRRWLLVLLFLIAVQLTVSFTMLPYSQANRVITTVEVTGYQFNWSMDKTQLPVNSTVRFSVTSNDVNHAFGVYDPDGEMLGVVQAMPGYHNKVDIKLTKIGNYHVWCLEFCGINHDKMTRDFSVVGE